MPITTAQTIRGELRKMGPAVVRKLLSEGRFGEYKANLARQFLADIDRTEAAASKIEQSDIARSAADAALRQANAAEDANRKADIANKIAAVALAFAVIAIGISIAGLFLHR